MMHHGLEQLKLNIILLTTVTPKHLTEKEKKNSNLHLNYILLSILYNNMKGICFETIMSNYIFPIEL